MKQEKEKKREEEFSKKNLIKISHAHFACHTLSATALEVNNTFNFSVSQGSLALAGLWQCCGEGGKERGGRAKSSIVWVSSVLNEYANRK